jgi:hypothetical protein
LALQAFRMAQPSSRSPKCFGRKGWGSWWGRYKFSKVKALWIYILYIYTNSQKSKLYSAWEYRH